MIKLAKKLTSKGLLILVSILRFSFIATAFLNIDIPVSQFEIRSKLFNFFHRKKVHF